MRKILIILLFLPFISFSQNIGCTNPLALNFDPIADVDDGSCIYCDSLANFSSDTIIINDSLIQLNVLNIADANYSWNSSNIYNGQNIQTLLNYGYTPIEINNLLNLNPTFGSVDSLYNKEYQGGVIFFLDTLSGGGFVAAPNDEDSTTWGWVCIVGDTIGQMTSDSLYAGENNTNLILHGSGPACSQLGIAAELCYSSTQEGFDDWFLPSQDELTKLYNNLFFIDSLSFAQDFIGALVKIKLLKPYTLMLKGGTLLLVTLRSCQKLIPTALEQLRTSIILQVIFLLYLILGGIV